MCAGVVRAPGAVQRGGQAAERRKRKEAKKRSRRVENRDCDVEGG